MTRRKADKLPAAQSKAEAITLLGRYAALQASIDARRAQAEAAIAKTRAAVDAAIAPDEAELKAISKLVRVWWSVACNDLTDGKRKSIELGGCLIGHRMTPPRLALAGLTDAEAIDTLEGRKLTRFVRVKTELNKPALIAAFGEFWGAVVLLTLGFRIAQKEEFFIAPIPPVEPATIVVEDALAEQVPA